MVLLRFFKKVLKTQRTEKHAELPSMQMVTTHEMRFETMRSTGPDFGSKLFAKFIRWLLARKE